MDTSNSLARHGWLPDRAWEWIALVAVLVLATVLRLQSPGVVEFKRDEAALSLLGLDLAHGHDLPLLGIGSSVGVPNSPVSVYLLALPYALSTNPQWATGFIALLNVGAVFGVYAIARRYRGPTAGLIAAMALAVSPWAVIYSRKIWAQDLLPPFVVVAMAAGLLGFLERKRTGQFLFLPLLAIAGQLHFAAVVLLPAALLLLWWGRRNLTRWFWFSLPVAVLCFAPYAIGLARADLLNPAALAALRASSAGATSPADPLIALQYAWLTISGADLHALAGPYRFRDYLATIPDLTSVVALTGIAVLASATWLLIRAIRRRDALAKVDGVLLVWAMAAPIVFLLPWTPVYPHYFIPILPACALIAGMAAANAVVALRPKPAGRVILGMAAVGVALIVAGDILAVTSLLRFVESNATPGGFGTPLARLLDVRDAVLSQSPADVVVSVDDPDASIVWRALLYDAPSLRFDGGPVAVYPAGEGLRLDECAPGETGMPLRPDEGCLAIRPTTAFDVQGWTLGNTPPFANGAQIAAWRWDAEAGCLDLAWRAAGPANADYHLSVRLTEATGATLANADALGWPGAYWRAGDTVARRFCVPDAAAVSDATGATIGFYTYSDGPNGRVFSNVDVLDSAGLPAEQQITLAFEAEPTGDRP